MKYVILHYFTDRGNRYGQDLLKYEEEKIIDTREEGSEAKN